MASRKNSLTKLSIVTVVIFLLFMLLLTDGSISCQPPPSLTPTPHEPPTPPTAQPTSPPPAQQPAKWVADGIIESGEYAKMRTFRNFEINWFSDDNHIYIGIKAKTTGWLALGIQPGTMMKDADMVLGFVKDGKVTVVDQFSTGTYGPHRPDTELGGSNNIIEYGGREEASYTIIEFKRALSTGDRYDHQLFKGVNKIIWAIGAVDEFTLKHTARGYGEIDL